AMTAVADTGAVVYRSKSGVDAIDEYSRRLVQALNALDADAVSACYVGAGIGSMSGERPAWVLLQYNPFGYGRSGFAPGLVRDVRRLRQSSHAPLAVMVHEAWVDMTDAKSSLIGLWQRAQLRLLLPLADRTIASTEAIAREIGRGALHMPVASNITPVTASREDTRTELHANGRLVIALFGRANPSRAIDHAEAAIAALASAHGAERLLILNLGVDAPPLHVPADVEVHHPGLLAADELSRRLLASDLVLLPFTDGVSTRRSTMMAAFAHGTPVLGLKGCNTDTVLAQAHNALELTPVGDLAAYAHAAVRLTSDQTRLREIGQAGRALYESRFDWPVMARRFATELRAIAGGRRRDVMFVAHDIGGPGGMERHTEQLIGRVLDTGRNVTVVARTCGIEPRQGLRFKRLRTPRRPFVIAYPAFFFVASLIASHRRNAVLHATGAIIANDVDIVTVHYCHRAARTRVEGSRASRTDTLYRLNSSVAGFMSRSAETWCFRPKRTRVLCAVSDGVAGELRTAFPAMAGAIRTVANGVDAAVFRPNAAARRVVREELGLSEEEALALFVGGDWDRKGLPYAVDALALAPDWQLAVAGTGDRVPLVERARRAGTESRLRFLGRVRDMPRLYAASDAFIMPTTYEAFPLVSLEAAASGLPLLVTRVNGVEDFLEDGRSGWFITRDGTDIAKRLNELRADPELVRAMATRARAAVSGYSWQAMAEGYLSLYEELTHGA
ncbi:MAG: glycosyltransferase, partial [Solirubrobacteraceae bacterium]